MEQGTLAPMADHTLSFADYRGQSYFPNLDGVRFLCIAAVLWHHTPLSTVLQPYTELSVRGFLGVDFFFVLSGFLITTLLLREADRDGQFSLRGFYWRRALRILPIYFLVVTLTITLFSITDRTWDYWAKAPAYYLFLANFIQDHVPTLGITWSLSVEEQYYLIWPLLLLLLGLRWSVYLLFVVIALNVVAVQGLLRPFGIAPFDIGIFRFELHNATYAPILMGSLLAIGLHLPRSFGVLSRILAGRYASSLALIVLIGFIWAMPQDLVGWPNLGVHVLMTLTLASFLVSRNDLLFPFMNHPRITRIGQISYGIYLYHMLCSGIVAKALSMAGLDLPILHLVIYVSASIVAAELSFRYYESYFQRFR